MPTATRRKLLGAVVLVAVAAVLASAALDPSFPFIARWGGHTKDLGFAVATDGAEVLVTGATFSADFPVSTGARSADQTWCAFLTRLQAANGALVRSSVLCGRGMTYGRAVTAGGRGRTWVAGSTDGPGLPVSRDAAQPRFGGGSALGFGDAFFARFDIHGEVNYVSYLGGAGDETVWGITSDRAGGIWAAGSTTSRPLFPGMKVEEIRGGTLASADGFIVHVGAEGRIEAAKILGGHGVDELYDVALIDPHSLVVVGATASSDAVLGKPRGEMDGFVALVDAATLTVSWILRIGGSGHDALRAVAVVEGRTIVAAGRTEGGACRARRGGSDGWLVTVSKVGALLRSECVGTAAADALSDVAVTADGAIWVTGTTDVALRAAARDRASRGDAHDRAFAMRLASIRGSLGSLRFLSQEISRGYAIAAGAEGRVYAVGETTAVPSRTGNWAAVLIPTPGAFHGEGRPGSTDPYVIALPR